MIRVSRQILAGAVAAAAIAGVASADWPQWRGPGHDAVAAPFQAPKTWPEKLKQVWSIEAGGGHASPVVVAGKVYLHSRQGEDEVIAAYNLQNGKPLWKDRYPVPYAPKPEAAKHGKGPFSTPTFHDGRLYTYGINEVLSAYDAASGKLLWRQDYAKEFQEPRPYYGAAASPLVVDGMVIVPVGGPGKGALVALDAKTGAQKWRRDTPGEGPSYASPVVGEFSGVRQIVTQAENSLIGVALADGALLWQIPYKVPYGNNIVTAVMHGDTFIVSGMDLDLTAVRPVKKDGKWTAETVWGNRQGSMYMTSPALAAGVLYGHAIRNRGQLFAIDPKDGKVLWTGPPGQGENGNVVSAGDYLFVLKDSAELEVVRRTPESYQKVAAYEVADSATWAYPVVLGDKILVKDANKLTLWSVG
jgi:outer membrane protein assembly factor BamB